MYVIWVSPISSRVRVHTLTYYTAEEIPVGSIIDVPIRANQTPALVLHQESVADVKTFLRRAGFSARRITHTAPIALCSKDVLSACEYTARFHACSMGAVIRSCIPKAILDNPTPITRPTICLAKTHEKRAIQMSYADRIEAYKTIIRETFALRQSVVLVTPTAHETQAMAAALRSGIHTKIQVLTTTDTPATQRENWHTASMQDGPLLICTTPSSVAIPRCDIGLYIVEHTSSQAYKKRTAPYIDVRVLVRALAEQSGASIFFADTLLPLAYYEQIYEGTMNEYDTMPKRIAPTVPIQIIDMKAVLTEAKAQNATAEFPVLAPKSISALTHAIEQGGKAFVLATQRGFAGTTTCDDCGTIVHCARCEHPVALHTKKEVRVFLCHRCGESRSAKERCVTCNGWRLTPLGRGVERIEATLKKEFKKTPLFRIDTDSTPKMIASTIEKWNEHGGIVVGTERALHYISDMHTSVCASLDTLLSVPDFRIDERVFSLLLRLQERSTHNVLIQTQQPHAPVLVHALSGNVGAFIKNELALRKQLHYPPYTVIVRCTCIGSKTTVTKQMQSFAIALARHKPRIFGSFVHKGNQVQLSALLRVKRDAWPKKDIVEYLRSLPPCWSVDVLPTRSEN